MLNFKIDAEFALALLGIFAIIIIISTILFVSRQLGIQTYSVLETGSPCPKVFCDSRYSAEEIGRDWEQGIAYCQCENGMVKQASLFSQ